MIMMIMMMLMINDDDSSREPLNVDIMITLQIGVSGSARDKLAANYVPSTVVFL